MIYFTPENHKYKSIDPKHDIKWTSVTSIIKNHKEEFDADTISEKSGKNKKSKWYGLTADQIKHIWNSEAVRSIELGNWYHDQRETDILGLDTLQRYGKDLPIIHGLTDGKGRKTASSQRLIEGIYPELMVYLKSLGVCGQADLVEVANGFVHITDYKTNKDIKTESYRNWEGTPKMMFNPISHIEDCSFNHYQLQLSIYMYIILKHNPRLKPGRIVLQHAKFKTLGENKWGYPIHERINGEYVLENVVPITCSYMKSEVIALLNHQKNL